MLRHIPKRSFVEGRWRNGLGVSWNIATQCVAGDIATQCVAGDIASRGDGEDFDWRFALARIDGDVDFSVYGPVDRVFTLVAGEGLTLDFGAGKVIEVDAVNVPHAYACDVPLHCRVKGRGPALALNLFTARGRWNAEVDVVALKGGTEVPLSCNAAVLLALEGDCEISRSGERLHLREGDAAEVRGQSELVASGGGYLYVGRLTLMSA